MESDLFGDEPETQQDLGISPQEKDENEQLFSDDNGIGRDNTLSQSPQNKPDALNENEDEDEGYRMEARIPNFPFRQPENEKIYLARLPQFLARDHRPFNPEEYLLVAEEDAQTYPDPYEKDEQIKRRVENTLRWRNMKDASGDYVRQTNTRFIKWSDGSLSLKVGSELFDVQLKESEYAYLAQIHEAQELIHSKALVNYEMTFVPADVNSETHKRFAESLALKQVRGRAIQEIFTNEDPEKVKREAEKAEEERIRSRKRLENKQERTRVSRYEGNVTLTAEGLEGEDNFDTGTRVIDRYAEDEDDFVVDDETGDAEDSRRAERLRSLKEEGARRYKDQTNQEDEESAPGSGDENDDSAPKVKKRRIITSDDEE